MLFAMAVYSGPWKITSNVFGMGEYIITIVFFAELS